MTVRAFAAPSNNKKILEEGTEFTPKFDPATGLLTAVVTDAASGDLLMVAHMNTEALDLTLNTGIAHYWSRSRAALWKKGETSGNFQRVVELRTDCDQDALWLKVEVAGDGNTCHTDRHSCFYRVIRNQDGDVVLAKDEHLHASP